MVGCQSSHGSLVLTAVRALEEAFTSSIQNATAQPTPSGSGSETEEDIAVCCPYKGVLIYMFGAFCMALGVNLQKYSINREQIKHKEEKDRRSLWRQPYWVFGLITYGSSGGLLSLALAFAKQSQLAPLMSIVIISNALLARFLLYEPVSKRDMSAIVIIVCAVVLSTVFAPQSENTLKTTEGLIALYKEAGFIIFVSLLVTLLITFYIGNRYILAKIDPNPPYISRLLLEMNPYRKKNIEVLENIAKGQMTDVVENFRRRSLYRSSSAMTYRDSLRMSNNLGHVASNKIAHQSQTLSSLPASIPDEESESTTEEFVKKISKFQESFFAFSFGGQAGLWGGLCVTMMKSAISIIIDEFSNNSIVGIFVNPLMYALLGVLICCWTFQLYWINTGLERYPAVFVVSIEAVLNELTAVCGGILYFKEYLEFEPLTAVLFSVGLLFGVFGIMLFATRDNYNLSDDFFTCWPIDENYHVSEDNDPRAVGKREKPVDEQTRRASFKRSSVRSGDGAISGNSPRGTMSSALSEVRSKAARLKADQKQDTRNRLTYQKTQEVKIAEDLEKQSKNPEVSEENDDQNPEVSQDKTIEEPGSPVSTKSTPPKDNPESVITL